jgi:S-DNA-T family DNA segregation ATPase FtsK/SpoIIIE
MLLGACTYYAEFSFFRLGGDLGYYANHWLCGLVGVPGMLAVNVILLALWILVCYNTIMFLYKTMKSVREKRRMLKEENENVRVGHNQEAAADFKGDDQSGKKKEKKRSIVDRLVDKKSDDEPADKASTRKRSSKRTSKPGDDPDMKIQKARNIELAKGVTNPHDPTGEYMHYRFPTLDLLADIKTNVDNVDISEQENNKRRIVETLGQYGIGIKNIIAHVGPTVTLFEIVPEEGVRISKIRNLEDDIALSLAALGIRIIAPMPGRGTIGIEVPNHDPQVVPMREVIASKAFQESKAALPMVLGCTVSNDVFVTDLAKMPHLLVAGATGQGKSVGLNAIIASLLYKKGPSELKFVLIDPKKVEFSLYASLEKYFFAKVEGEDKAIITDTAKVVQTLNSLVQEMENRYLVLEEVGERKLEDYNRRWKNELRHKMDESGKFYQYMPYIVVIVDEFSDLIMTAGKEVETPIVRIAQKARAVGIHMIIATQRPSSNVITGLIKANFPGRIAFRVSQLVDSRLILDRPGAQQLIGRGDMLFSANGEITRLQCPLIDTPEIVNICYYIKEQEDADTEVSHEQPYILPDYEGDTAGGGDDYGSSSGALGDRDPLFEEIAKLVVQSDTASTSSLQRRYNIGYNRAGRIMDQLEAAGIVGPASGGKPRKVLMDPMDLDQMF